MIFLYQNVRPYLRVLTETPLFRGYFDSQLNKNPLFQHHQKNPTPIEVRFQEFKISFMVATLPMPAQGCNLIFLLCTLQEYAIRHSLASLPHNSSLFIVLRSSESLDYIYDTFLQFGIELSE